MKTYNRRKILISQHIPKCGGTSFTEVLRAWFWPSFHGHYIAHDQGGRMPTYAHPVKRMLHASGIKPLVVHGHFEADASIADYYPRASQFITILRDPLEMQLSLYWDHQRRIREFGTLYWKGEKEEIAFDGDLDRWVAERGFYLLSFLPFGLTHDNFKQVLSEKFVHIGVMERYVRSIHLLADKLGKRPVKVPELNPSPREREPSDWAVEQFREKTRLEYEIYEWALEMNA